MPSSPNKSLPFCSERCKMEDLSRWLGGDYRISTQLGWASAHTEGESDSR